jgi:hypothetical protein
LRAENFAIKRARWTSTVRGEMSSARAISFEVNPSAIIVATCRSRRVRVGTGRTVDMSEKLQTARRARWGRATSRAPGTRTARPTAVA